MIVACCMDCFTLHSWQLLLVKSLAYSQDAADPGDVSVRCKYNTLAEKTCIIGELCQYGVQLLLPTTYQLCCLHDELLFGAKMKILAMRADVCEVAVGSSGPVSYSTFKSPLLVG